MGALWVVAEPGPDGGLARISAEAATRVIRDAPDEAARQVVAFLAERRLI